ncbi:MAG: hypothetical protein DI538_03820 [Azospira oryzae]|jgi:hypothetical protein|nr:MAG: hypothetical protein DI538_03820 [Azospira oryzae]
MKFSIPALLIIVSTIIVGIISVDLLFSKPDHLQGVLLEKIFVPGRLSTGDTPYASKRSRYFVTHQKEDQWVAIVKTDEGDTLKVHCLMDHYETKKVGDRIHFKKYDGHLVHIDYFAHNEEDD